MNDRFLAGRGLLIAAMLVTGFAAPAVRPEVVTRSASGFQSTMSVWVSRPPREAYERAVGAVARWWDPAHTYSGDAANLTLAASAGGCFCETLPGGGSVQHLEVAYVQPGAAIRLLGGLGPLQDIGAGGELTWKFESIEGRTRVTWTYRVTGMDAGDVAKLSGPVDQVLAVQLARLGRFIETGTP
jgi:hypothetical protein